MIETLFGLFQAYAAKHDRAGRIHALQLYGTGRGRVTIEAHGDGHYARTLFEFRSTVEGIKQLGEALAQKVVA